MKQKKRLFTGAILLAAALFIGWKVKPVELIDDKLLIDLDTAIVEAGWGQEGNPDDAPDDTKQEGDKDNNNTGTTDKPNTSKNTITVAVQGEKITLDGVTVKDAATLRSRLSAVLESDSTVVLEDNYAEAHVYRDVLQVLEIMQNMNSFKLSEVAK